MLTRRGDADVVHASARPPIRSLIGEGTVLHGELRLCDGCASTARSTATWSPTDGRSLLVVSEKARVHGKVKAAM
jgi:hypothetical protein